MVGGGGSEESSPPEDKALQELPFGVPSVRHSCLRALVLDCSTATASLQALVEFSAPVGLLSVTHPTVDAETVGVMGGCV